MGGEIDLLKILAGAGGTGAVVLLVYFGAKAFGAYLDKVQAASEKKDVLFAATLRENTAENRAALQSSVADMKAGLTEIKGAVENLGRVVTEIDKSHTQQSRDTFLQLIQLNDKQNGAIATMVSKVEHLDETVDRMSETLEDHGRKLDALTVRSLPPPADTPGGPAAGDFRAARP